jgi:hypothetical protein
MPPKELAEIRESIRRLEEKLDAWMVGEKGKGNGLLPRITRLETIEEHRRWHLRAVWTAVLALLFKLAADLFRRGG